MSSPLPPALLEAPLLLDLVPPVQPTSSMTKRPLLPPPLLFLLLATLAVAIALIVGVVCLGGRWVSSSIGVALVGGWDGSADVASSDAIPPHFLPDPFTFLNGSSVTTRAQWLQRREEIGELLQRFELGPKMPRPAQLTGSVTSTAITVRAGHGNASITFTSQVTLPTTGKAPYPAMIGLGSISLNVTRLLELGVAIIMFNNSDIAEQNGPQSRGQGKFYTLYPNNPAGALMAWAWAVSTLIDVLEESGRDMFDVRRLGVTGCSRNGKGSLVVGAFDERIALSIPQESGSGGAASWRMSDWQNDQDTPPGGKQAVQTLGEIVGENVQSLTTPSWLALPAYDSPTHPFPVAVSVLWCGGLGVVP